MHAGWSSLRCQAKWGNLFLGAFLSSSPIPLGKSFAESGLAHVLEWNYSRNHPLTPRDVYPSAKTKVWWICKSNHEWEESLNNRSKGRGCPFCSGRRCIPGVNDLATLHPELLEEVSDKNSMLDLVGIHPGSTQKINWTCKAGHYWDAPVRSRVRGYGCPSCSSVRVDKGRTDIASQKPEWLVEWSSNNPDPAEVAVHSNKKYEWICELNKKHVFLMSPNDKSVSRRNGCPYCSAKKVFLGETDLGTTHPDLTKEWGRQNKITYKEVTAGSSLRVSWTCPSNHDYVTTVSKRAKRGQGCPICSNKRVVQGENDMATTHPELAAEIDLGVTENQGWETLSAGSARMLAWRCKNDHRWLQRAVVRSRMGTGCPFCAGQRVVTGQNDFATSHPHLLKEWDFAENGDLDPKKLFPNTEVTVHWICRSGHKWATTLAHRASLGIGCPYCSGRKASPGINDVQSSEFGDSWDYELNEGVDPAWVHRGSTSIFYWRCLEGHSWRTASRHRNEGSGCPTCAPSAFSPVKPGILYLIKQEKLRAMKVGITNGTSSSDRLDSFQKAGWEVVSVWRHPEGWRVSELESQVLTWIRSQLKLPVYLSSQEMGSLGGWTETFSLDGPNHELIISQIEAQASEIFSR